MKKLYLFAALAAMLAACSENDLSKETADLQQNAEEGAVVFDAYMQRTTSTRGGVTGVLRATDLKNTLSDFGKAGFGVFGYYTDNGTYDQQAIPNFFYNQQVTYNGDYFEYTPVKYWPNEYGKSAISEDQDKVSYFAYAPYVQVTPSTGKVVDPDAPKDQAKAAEQQKWGINSLSRNSATGDPLVKYIASFDQDKSVDLLWGVCDDTNWPIVVNGSSQKINQGNTGLPWIDVQRPADPTELSATTGQKVKFTFKHATAQLKVMIDAFVDGTDHTNLIKPETKVYVRSISFEGFAMKGALNLNNTEAGPNNAYWMDFNGGNDLVTGETVTIYDGRKDGKEGTPSGEATNEKTLGLNPALVQSTVWKDANAMPGVTQEPKNLFRKWNPTGGKDSEGAYEAADAPIYVIPTGDPVRVKIVYDIETADGNLSTYVSDAIQTGSSIENCIEKDINFGSGEKAKVMKNGKSYLINLHLGMNSVKFDADVTEWVETSDADVDLPKNVPVFAVSTDPYTVTLPADVTSYTFAVSGLDGGKTIDLGTPADPVSYTGPTVTANAAGVALITATIAKNTTVNGTATGSITVSDGTNSTTIKINQAPHPLELSVKSVNFVGKEILLGSTTSGWAAEVANLTDVEVTKNGAKLMTIAAGGSDPNNTEVQWNTSGTDPKIVFAESMQIGDVYTITIKAGEADKETVTYKVPAGSLSFPAPKVEVKLNETPTVNTVTQEGDGTVNYSSTNTTVAEVNASSGAITIKAAGITTITATVSGSTCLYPTTTATYTIVVYDTYNAANDVTSGYTKESISVGSEGGEGYFIISSGFNANDRAEVEPSCDQAWVKNLRKEIIDKTLKVYYTVETGSSRSADITVKTATNKGVIVTVNQ